MNYRSFVGKITEYLLICTISLSKWLEDVLPQAIDEDYWWDAGVIGKLSFHQLDIIKEKDLRSIAELDLSMLLRVASRNWYHIQNKKYLKYNSRMTIDKMFDVRNNWAHTPAIPPSISEIRNNLLTIKDFLILIKATREDIKEYEKFFSDIQVNGITDLEIIKSNNEKPEFLNNINLINEIGNNSIVRLVSDPNTIGIVTDKNQISNTIQYCVFINGKTKTFFDGQIELVPHKNTSQFSHIIDVQRKLTAYQIKKPSSDSLYSLNAARIDFVPYQFRPALKLIKSDTPRLLIADSVGVGKTIEAGLIIKEMQARTTLDSILIICPRPLVAEEKWQIEMKRFDEDFTHADGNILRDMIKEIKRDGVLPDKYKRLIISDSLLTNDLLGEVTTLKKGGSGLLGLETPPSFDMIIVDEAHRMRNSNTQKYKLIEYLCNISNAAVFLTATPIQLGNNDLYTLLNLLFPNIVTDKTAFNLMAEPNSFINSAIRNLRIMGHEKEALEQLKQAVTTEWGSIYIKPTPTYINAVKILTNGIEDRKQRVNLLSDIESLHSFSTMINRTRRQDIEDFCVRRANTLESKFTKTQNKLYESLLEFVAEILSIIHPTITLKFLMCTLYRQAASCIFGLAPFIKNITEHHLLNLFDEYDLDDNDISDEENIIDSSIIRIFKEKSRKLINLAESLPEDEDDEKFDKFAKLLTECQHRENNKVIVFTSFRHTIAYLNKKLRKIIDVRVDFIDGTINDENRRKLRERFMLPKENENALDVLLFTEVGSEGLDYQFCDTIVNYDLPWNPMRIEQRIGRIDRRGQESDIAYIYNCVTQGTIDEEIFDRCLSRIGVFEQSIGDCEEILGAWVKSISDLVLDTKLTDEERVKKLERLRDNDVRKIHEMQRLENEQKHIFGVDISSFVDDINKADNPWLSPIALFRLVKGYLEYRLGTDNIEITEEKLKLKQIDKAKLEEDYKKLDNNYHDPVWHKYLKSSNTTCKIAFDHETAKDPKSLFITPMHPLVRQAANAYFSDDISKIVVKTTCSDIAPGSYPFQFYTWEYTGSKPQTLLLPISINDEIQNELSNIMQNAVTIEFETDNYEIEWKKLSETHLNIWQKEREKFKIDIEAHCKFKIESLERSIKTRKIMPTKQLSETKDERIKIMKEAEIKRLDNELIIKKNELDKMAKIADIHTSLLVNGVLVVEG